MSMSDPTAAPQENPPLLSPAAAAPASPLPPAPVASDFQPLDPRVIKLWRIHHLIGTGVLLALLLVPGVIVALNFDAATKWVAGGWLAVLALRLWLLWWYPRRAYHAWGYRLDGQVLETRRGIWWRTLELLPLSRLQHVDLHSGPIERSFGLASLILHTAGTHNATITVPGLAAGEAARLRDHLVAVGGDDGV
jgi:hypothetical protein